MANLAKLFSKSFRTATLVLVLAPIAISQELGTILYRNWAGLCNVSAENTAKPRCTTSHYHDFSWQPHGDRIVADGRQGLVLLDAKGHLTSKLEGQSGGRPTWSPDGQYIFAIS